MSAIDITQLPGSVVVTPEKNSRITIPVSVFVEVTIRGFENPPQIPLTGGTVTAKVRLQIGHKQGGCHTLPRNIGKHKANLFRTQIEKVVIVSSDPAGLDALGSI